MSSNQQLFATLTALNYPADTIRAIMQVAETTEANRLASLRASQDSGAAIPAMVASESSSHAWRVKRLVSTIYNASLCSYKLPVDRVVDIHEVNAAIKAADPTTKAQIHSELFHLGLIPA